MGEYPGKIWTRALASCPPAVFHEEMTSPVLLVAEDDASDALLLERALRRANSPFRMLRVANGAELIEYLERRGPYADQLQFPAPTLVLLDLKMPRKDGFDVLRWRQQIQGGTRLPVVVFTSSGLEQDVEKAFALGANSFVIKPLVSGRLEVMVQSLHSWWVEFNVPAKPWVA
jgi:CheY-like chemotaxis protein